MNTHKKRQGQERFQKSYDTMQQNRGNCLNAKAAKAFLPCRDKKKNGWMGF